MRYKMGGIMFKNHMLLLVICSFTFTGCATRTQYKPHGSNGGYSETMLDEKVMVVRFAGNTHTKQSDAAMFSQFRAIEICKENGFKVARLYHIADKSVKVDVQRTFSQTDTSPTHFNGTARRTSSSNYNLQGTAYGGETQSKSSSWTETLVSPTYDTYFKCTNKINVLGVSLKDVNIEDMKPYVKDLMGAVQIDMVHDDSANKKILRAGDIIVKIDNERVNNNIQLINALDSSKNSEKVPVQLFREGKLISTTAKLSDGTETLLTEINKIISAVCTVEEVKTRPICKGRSTASK